MDASAEQLVLDYLRRLGDASQQVLGPGERIAFMTRARADIARQLAEHRAGAAGDVLRVLGRYGDPRELAARERRRLDELTATLAAAASAEDAVVAGERGPDDVAGAGEAGGSATGGQTPAAPGEGAGSATGGQTPAAPGEGGSATGGQTPAAPGEGGGSATGGQAPAVPGEVLTGTPVTPGRALAGTPAASGGRAPGARPPGQRPFAAPRPHRPITARWRPGGAPRRPGGEPRRPDHTPADPRGEPRWPGRTPSEPGGLRQLLGGPPRQLGSAPQTTGQATRALGSSTPGQPSGTPPHPGDTRQPGQGPQQRRGPGATTPGVRLTGVLTLARRHPLETVAVLLLGVGGLIDPFPLWLLGAATVLVSRLWDARDKWAALAVPVGFALVGAIAIAGLTARSGSLAGYVSTVRIDGWDLIRAGSVAGAAYLAWRVRQGRRPRREPPWRRPPRG